VLDEGSGEAGERIFELVVQAVGNALEQVGLLVLQRGRHGSPPNGDRPASSTDQRAYTSRGRPVAAAGRASAPIPQPRIANPRGRTVSRAASSRRPRCLAWGITRKGQAAGPADRSRRRPS